MVEQQPDVHPHIQELFSWAEEARRLGVGDAGLKIDRPFIPDQEITAYLKDIRRIKNLLAALDPDGNPQLDPETIRNKYPKVFLILLLTGNGRFISHFVRHDSLCDQYLPFRTRPQQFPRTSNIDFFTSFCCQQWEFCAQIFHDGTDQHFDAKDLILPIISIEKLGGGGSATVHKIGLHPAYNKLGRNRVPRNGSTQGDAHTFVLKTYNTPDAEDYYRNEVNGFLNPNVRGGSNTNIIGFHGSFIWHGTYNVLLEYADRGTLEKYFDIGPPSSGEGIINVWRELCKILPALAAIHGGQPSDPTTASTFQGWHQDIKPSNILVKSKDGGSPCDVEFKIADLGVSHFKRHVISQGEAIDRDTYGTRAYGAPECYRADGDIERVRFQVSQNVDIWSLGCVFSEAAVWLVYGKGVLLEYRRRRGYETVQFNGFRDGNCFHDGRQVLTTVTNIHKALRAHARRSDHVTRRIVHMVTDEMLIGSIYRSHANSLYHRTQRILSDAEDQLRNSALNTGTGSVSRGAIQSRPRTPPEPPPGHREPRSSNSYNQRLPSHHHAGSPVNTSYNEAETHHQGYIDGSSLKWPLQEAHYSDQSTQPQSTGLLNQDQFSDFHLNRTISDDAFSQDGPDGPYWQEPPSPNSQRRRISSDLVSAGINRNISDTSTRKRHETYNVSGRNAFTASPREISRISTTTLIQDPYNGARGSQHQSRSASVAQSARLVSTRLSNVHPSMGNNASQRPPVLTVADAERWKRDKKEHRPVQLPGGHLLADLDLRDHVFLIDNSLSMRPHRGEVRDLFALLGYLVKSKDPDGIELLFTMSSERKDKAKNTGQLLRTLDTVSYIGKSNIRLQLGEILQDYHTKLRDQNPPKSLFNMMKPRRRARRQTVYIFTDGVWQPECDPSEMIEKLVKSLEHNSMEREQFGIQFIRFGNDPEGKVRLDKLDSGLGLSMDIVDTESSKGNVFKMIFGAINNWYDGDNVNFDNSALAPPGVDRSTRMSTLHGVGRRATHT